MLPTNLNTNEVKSSSGTEVEFIRNGPLITNPRSMEFAFASEVPSRPFRMSFAHTEQGDGRARMRNSVFKTSYLLPSTYLVDATIASAMIIYTVARVPIGNLTAYTDVKEVCAGHGSALMSRGVDSTILFNCTGIGMESLLNGTL